MDLRDVLANGFARQGFITSRQLQRAMGISRQSVWERLRLLVQSGELAFDGFGRGIRYVPGPGWPLDRGVVRGGVDQGGGFWEHLTSEAPELAYVSVRRASRGTQRAEHARALVFGLDLKDFVIVDFEGLDRISDPFADALLRGLAEGGTQSVTINACPAVQRSLELARRRVTLHPESDWDE